MIKFDYAKARQDGATDAEIVTFLAQQAGFDLASARRDGANDYEVITFLSTSPGVDYSKAPNESKAETKRNKRDNRTAYNSTTTGKVLNTGVDVLRGVGDTLTLGHLDEGLAFARSTLSDDPDLTYEQALAEERVRDDQAGGGRLVGQVVGGFIPFAGQAARGLQALKGGANLARGLSTVGAGTVGRTAAVGAGTGAVYGAGSSEETEVGRIAADAGKGAALSAVGGVGGGLIGAGVNRVQRHYATKALPTVEALKDTAQASYKAADDLGVAIKPKPILDAIGEAKGSLAAKGITDRSPLPEHQQVFQAIRGVEEAIGTQRISWQGMEQARRSLTALSRGSTSPEVRSLIGEVVETLDDRIQGLKPGDFIGPGAKDAGKALKLTADARSNWRQAMKGDVLQKVIEDAELAVELGQKTSVAEAYRTKMRSLIQSKRFKLFNKEEQEVIKKAMAQGTTSKLIGILDSLSAGKGVVANTASLGTAYATGGASIPAQLGVMGASKLRDRAFMGDARMLSREISSGQRAAPIYDATDAAGLGLGSGLFAGQFVTE